VSLAQESVEGAINEVIRLHRYFAKLRVVQIQANSYKQLVNATAHAWFNTHRGRIATVINEEDLSEIDGEYRALMSATAKNSMRAGYVNRLKRLTKLLQDIRVTQVVALVSEKRTLRTVDNPPNFSTLVSDVGMQAILNSRWSECVTCVQSGAPLAAIVMMGGLLEGILLAKINQLSDKSVVFKAKTAPKDKTRGKPLDLREWTLKSFIDVSHELGWISQTGKDVSVVLRDYRNYIHPQKEYSHGIKVEQSDALLLWEISKSVIRQLL
jgi:hypothetical protein